MRLRAELAAAAAPLARLLLLMLPAPASGNFVVVGYVPEWRWRTVNWASAVQRTTHLVLSAVEPMVEGDLAQDGLQRTKQILQPGSPLRLAMSKAGEATPRIILGVSGITRTKKFNFSALTESQQARKRFAKRLVQVFRELPLLSGVDLDAEARSPTQFRDVGKLAVDIRSAFSKGGLDAPMLSMPYHPLLGHVEMFSGLQSKSTGKKFGEVFDLFHSMAFSKYDESRRHATFQIAQASMEEWIRQGLPRERLTLGLPLFGISRTNGDQVSYKQILDLEPNLAKQPDVDETRGGYYFNGPRTLDEKVQAAAKYRLAGVAVWELGQDKAVVKNDAGTLMRIIWNSAVSSASVLKGGVAVSKDDSFVARAQAALEKFSWVDEDNIILSLACIVGAVFSWRTLFAGPPVFRKLAQERLKKLPPPPPKKAKGPDPQGDDAGAVTQGTEGDGDDEGAEVDKIAEGRDEQAIEEDEQG